MKGPHRLHCTLLPSFFRGRPRQHSRTTLMQTTQMSNKRRHDNSRGDRREIDRAFFSSTHSAPSSANSVVRYFDHPGAQTRPLTPCKKLPPELSLSISFVKCFCCYERVHFVFRRSHEICVFAKYAQYITTPQRYLGFLLSPYRSRNNRTITSSLWVTETVERWCDEIVMGWRWEGLYRGGESLTEMEWALRSMDTDLFSNTRSCRWLAVVSLPFLASLIHPYCFTWHHRAS